MSISKCKAEYLVYCDASGEAETVTGKQAAVDTAKGILEEYADYTDTVEDGTTVDIYKLDSTITVKVQSEYILKEEGFTNGIRK